jgi:serine/threonine protein kinase/tetratricopeptide (TPR) repeat protein
MSDAAQHLMTIFSAALDCTSETDRAGFLDEACAGDTALRERVEALLRAHEHAGQFLEPRCDTPLTAALTAEATGGSSPAAGAVIGPYKLLEQIGEGGFGAVFLAEQQRPVRRKVALKVLKPGMDTRQVVARFEAERQVLALMDHPNIAKVHDGGATPSGLPYFVMELVKGVPITEFSDQNQLTPRQRLELFIPVCRAVQHAHQKGIIHRDLKPPNVLVTVHDTTPVVKVIDFGVAKALAQELTDKTLFSVFAQMIGTPLYMSPEQAGQGGLDIDTRSDIYSLGVLLYELLTGTTPFTKERFKEAAYEEIRRIIREEEPPRPSTRLSDSKDSLPAISARRHTEPARLMRLVRGDLDWIVMKALEKDRNRRYETASALAADVLRYLRDEPVEACPPSVWYRVRKFARRHQAGLAVAAGALLLVSSLLGGALWTFHKQDLRRAETERAVSASLSQTEMLLREGDKQLDYPARWQGTLGLAEAAMQRAEELLATGEGTDDLSVRVHQVRRTVDTAWTDSRLLAELERIQLEKTALKGGRFHLPQGGQRYAGVLRDYGVDPAAPEAAAARVRGSRLREALLATLQDWLRIMIDKVEQQRLEALLDLAEPARDAFRKRWFTAVRQANAAALAQLSAEPAAQTLTPAAALILAEDLGSLNQWPAAQKLLRDHRERHPGNFWLNHNLGLAFVWLEPMRPDEAVVYLTAAAALRPDSAGARLNLGRALYFKKDLEGTIRECRAALAIDPNYSSAHNNLGLALRDKKDLEGAMAEFRSAIASDPKNASAHTNLGLALRDKKDLEGAISAFRAAVDSDPRFFPAHDYLGQALHAKKDWEGAIREFQTLISLLPGSAEPHSSLGTVLGAKKDLPGAIREFRAALAIDPDLADAHHGLGDALKVQGELEEAVREYQAALKINAKYADAHNSLGLALRDKNDLEAALREFRAAIDCDPNHAHAHCNLGNALFPADREGAIREFRTAIDIDSKYVAAHYNLGLALQAGKDLDGAIHEFRTALSLDTNIPMARYNLGIALYAKKDLAGATQEFRAAILHDPNHAEAHCNLGHALVNQGWLADGLAALKTGHQLGSRRPNWPYQSASWVSNAERLMQLDAKLLKVLNGATQPADTGERLDLARLCQKPYRQLHVAAVSFFSEAFAAEATLADNVNTGHRYDAACAAALAGCGQGQDAAKLDHRQRRRLREQALGWLQADLTAWRQQLDNEPSKLGPTVFKQMRHWQRDADLTGVREAQAMARLPQAERAGWQKLWQDVGTLQQRAGSAKGR